MRNNVPNVLAMNRPFKPEVHAGITPIMQGRGLVLPEYPVNPFGIPLPSRLSDAPDPRQRETEPLKRNSL
jgi:hypothetical protein